MATDIDWKVKLVYCGQVTGSKRAGTDKGRRMLGTVVWGKQEAVKRDVSLDRMGIDESGKLSLVIQKPEMRYSKTKGLW